MNVSGKSDEKKTNKSCFALHLHHTQVLTPAHRMWVTWVFGSPGFNLFNLDRLWFAYLLTGRYWQPWPPGSLQKLSGMPEGTLTRNIQTHLHSCGQLASKLLIASLLFLLLLVLQWLLFCKRGGVKVASFKASSFLLLTFAHRGVSAIEGSASRRSGGENETTFFGLVFHFPVSRRLCTFWVTYFENWKSRVGARLFSAACAWKNLWAFSFLLCRKVTMWRLKQEAGEQNQQQAGAQLLPLMTSKNSEDFCGIA